MAIPGETPIPVRTCSFPVLLPAVSSILIELAFDQAGERLYRSRGIGTRRGDLDDRARRGGEHHQPHDRPARYGGAAFSKPNLRAEFAGGLYGKRGGAGGAPPLVSDPFIAPRHG